jgi:hypothetical protein
MITIFYIYLTGVAVVGLRLAWHLWFKLDEYDWHFHKFNVWVAFSLTCVFWPLAIVKPSLILDPSLLFTDQYGVAERARERERLRQDPPPCGSAILYRQEHARFEETFGEFLFSASAVERAILRRFRERPHLAKTDELAMLNWVQHRNDDQHMATLVPKIWWEFHNIANDLVRDGEGTVRCLTCEESFPNGEIIPRDEQGRPGWNFDRLHCPRGHPLLVVERTHLLMSNRVS